MGKPTDEAVPQYLPAGVEGLLRPDGRHDHVEHCHDRRDLSSAKVVADLSAALLDHAVGQNIPDGVQDNLLELIRNSFRIAPCSFSRVRVAYSASASTLSTQVESGLRVVICFGVAPAAGSYEF